MTTPLHQRQTIREAVKAALIGATGTEPVTYATAAGARVYETRVVPFGRLKLPAIAVYSLNESSDDQQTAPRELKRTLTLAIDAAVKAGDNVDDALDALCLQIERAMHADPTFGDVASDSTLRSTQIGVLATGDEPIGVAQLEYAVTYYTGAPEAADVVLADLETVDVKTSIGGDQAAADQAEDVISYAET